jgi:uncharacterized protein (TIGR00255 family)
MIKSMTGYGKAIAETVHRKITIEIKSLNSRQLDLNTKLPWLYKEKEPEIRNIVSQKLERGKIDLVIFIDTLDETTTTVINKPVFNSYFKQLKAIAGELNLKVDDQILPVVLKLPDTLKNEKPDLPEGEWELVRDNIIESVSLLDRYRIDEGKSIVADMEKRIDQIMSLLSAIEEFEEGRIIKIREKLSAFLEENIGSENIDRNRFEQELIYFLEKYDINEEKVRLKSHCDYFLETINSSPPNGRILNFISQEIGREINTIGSKANNASIQKLVVKMKDELEKIKEHTLNIL